MDSQQTYKADIGLPNIMIQIVITKLPAISSQNACPRMKPDACPRSACAQTFAIQHILMQVVTFIGMSSAQKACKRAAHQTTQRRH